jgi:hypothetical protein
MKYIGAFSSFLKVKKVIKKLRKQVGFQDYKKGFIIRKFIINSCSINLRSVSIKNGSFYSYKKRHIFYLEEDIDLEVDVCDDIKEFGYFSSKSEAKKCFNKNKSKKKIMVREIPTNQIYWDGGFFTDYL